MRHSFESLSLVLSLIDDVSYDVANSVFVVELPRERLRNDYVQQGAEYRVSKVVRWKPTLTIAQRLPLLNGCRYVQYRPSGRFPIETEAKIFCSHQNPYP